MGLIVTYFFIGMALLAWIGFFVNAKRQNGYGMAYTAALFIIWVVAASWWGGLL